MQIPRLPAHFDSLDEVKSRVVKHFQRHIAQGLAVAEVGVVEWIDVLLNLRYSHLA